MLTVGRSYLEKNAAKKSVTFNLRQNESTRWMRDFNLGDIVTAKYFDHLESKEIAEIHVTVNTSRDTTFIERIDVEMNSLSDAMVEYLAEWTIDYEDPYPFTPVPDWPPGPEPSPISLVYNLTTTEMRVTHDFHNTPPTWNQVWAPGGGQIALDFLLDLYDPKEKAVVVTKDSSDTYIYELTNLSSGSPTATLKQSLGFPTDRVHLRNTVQWADTWFLAAGESIALGGDIHVYHTHDRWNTMTAAFNAGRRGSTTSPVLLALSSTAASQDSGVVWTWYIDGSGHMYLRKSVDYGHTFNTGYQFPDYNYATGLWMPWIGNESQNYLYAGFGSKLYLTSDGGTTFNDITPAGKSLSIRGTFQKYNPISYTLNPLGIYLHTGTSTTVEVWRTSDGGTNWDKTGDYGIGSDNELVNVGGWPFSPYDIIFMTTKRNISVSYDGGATWTNKQWDGYNNGIWTIPMWID
jgi:hypothetical protein